MARTADRLTEGDMTALRGYLIEMYWAFLVASPSLLVVSLTLYAIGGGQ